MRLASNMRIFIRTFSRPLKYTFCITHICWGNILLFTFMQIKIWFRTNQENFCCNLWDDNFSIAPFWDLRCNLEINNDANELVVLVHKLRYMRSNYSNHPTLPNLHWKKWEKVEFVIFSIALFRFHICNRCKENDELKYESISIHLPKI